MQKYENVQQLSNYLSSNGIKPSFQRVKILERLDSNKDHPTVNDIYKDLIVEIPSLSKTTVYNTLNLFIKQGVVKTVGVDGNESRYDLITHSHGHFICVKCGQISDINLKQNFDLNYIEEEGNDVDSVELTVRGVCKFCKAGKQ